MYYCRREEVGREYNTIRIDVFIFRTIQDSADKNVFGVSEYLSQNVGWRFLSGDRPIL
ncbi:unnamed protein product [Amoebophrya sp. A25]|nr:unnamed protein product [Amoebophrya sp. A25]|eukprot:GSA25T00011311001.1